jgi:hypothetical protein
MNWIGYGVVFLIGGFLVVAPFVIRTNWLSKRATVRLEKLGIDIGAEGRTLLVLSGGMMAIAAAYFNYTSDQQDLNQKMKEAEEAKGHFTQATLELRDLIVERYTLDVHLDLDGMEPKDLFELPPSLTITFRRSARDEPDQITNEQLSGNNKYKITFHRQPTGSYLTVPDFQRGASLEVYATREDVQWSGELIPTAPRLKLYKVPKRQ